MMMPDPEQSRPVSRFPRIGPDEPVVVFDGVCRLCNAWVRFLLRFDSQARFRLCPAQSSTGESLLKQFDQPTDQYDSVLLVQGDRVWLHSDAVLEILRGLPAPWCWLSLLRVVPRPLRDSVYKLIARNRYRLFGRYETCVLPGAGDRSRFVNDDA